MHTFCKQVAAAAAMSLGASFAHADCGALPNWQALKSALVSAVTLEASGLNFDMWATLVDRDGTVCAVAFSGANRGAQWPGSRVISAQKANTANAFSLDGLALSTANLYSAVQPGGSLFGLQHSNPVDTSLAYGGNSANYGTANDFMVGKKIGGVNVFGGGLALYNAQRKVIGAVGVSGDTSCADHMIGWLARARRARARLRERRCRCPLQRRPDAPGQHRLRHHRKSSRRHWEQRGGLWSPNVPQYHQSLDIAADSLK